MLQYIDINQVHPHIDNPRKDLGDLTELAESIKANGILQNLTVVPRILGSKTDSPSQDGYTLVIGHRRHAAAKLAGLKEVPCMVANMSKEEQVATMLMENIQRNDLTVYEQAQGFQMLLNFDYSITDIAEKTGFSKTTVQRRVKLLELDQEKFKQSIDRGATLMDYAELEKIKNVKLRNKVLEKIGTSDFKWTLQSAIDEEERPKRKEALIKELQEFAKPCKNSNGLTFINCFYNFKKNDWKKPKDADKAEYYYSIESASIYLYKKEEKTEKKKVSKTEKSYKERDAQIKELTKRAYQLRSDFVTSFHGGKKYTKDIMAFAMIRLIRYGGVDPDALLKLLEIEFPKVDEKKDYMEMVNLKRDLAFKKYLEQPERTILLTAWSSLDVNTEKYYESHSYNFSINHSPNPTLDAIYDNLIAMGYEMSDEERALRDGTHKLFAETKEA